MVTNATFVGLSGTTGPANVTPFSAYTALSTIVNGGNNTIVAQSNGNTQLTEHGRLRSAAQSGRRSRRQISIGPTAVTLSVGNQTAAAYVNQAGIILNGGSSIISDQSNPLTLALGTAEGVIYVNGTSYYCCEHFRYAGFTVFGPLGGQRQLDGQLGFSATTVRWPAAALLSGGAVNINNAEL